MSAELYYFIAGFMAGWFWSLLVIVIVPKLIGKKNDE
jgi:hypothetical protein